MEHPEATDPIHPLKSCLVQFVESDWDLLFAQTILLGKALFPSPEKTSLILTQVMAKSH